jgi:hypothetical protein
MASAGSSKATTVIGSFSTAEERRAFSSVIYRFIDDKLTIIILTNHGDRIVDELAVDLAGICLPALKRAEANSDPDPASTAILKGVVSGLLKGNYEPPSFTPTMRIFLNTQQAKHFGNGSRITGRSARLFSLTEKTEETAKCYAIK